MRLTADICFIATMILNMIILAHWKSIANYYSMPIYSILYLVTKTELDYVPNGGVVAMWASMGNHLDDVQHTIRN
jgi:hypothetical protein